MKPKNIKKYSLILMLCAVCLLSLSACKGGISGDEAKATVNEFFEAVVNENYEEANALLHPDRYTDSSEFFLSIEEESGLDFQQGIEIVKYSGFSSSYYNSEVGGSRYELTMQVKIGESDMSFSVEIVKNGNGYGIYNLHLESI
ncbi:MAG: hypothetical protein IJC50_03195 [Clostridia bacterium]|nr:hypothetical protein [Clostridia bacterium]